ncbi:WD40 repeat domain-containing protein [Aspergillus affinis]|uniref:WD40 repeat domain-containing protein n=1 Tax=Aspergillus affinis TaxID=1070780 RepID=UPI0022FDB8AA|nr:NACHT nucleoside triphosphatase [Aspergillus affinis]KAI9035006.1 NACHT nucleoside triphosphatase [Aspergillus affinis]
MRYACVNWVDHLLCSNIESTETAIQAEDLVDLFLCESYLHWLEAMSILKIVPTAIASMQKLEKLVQSTNRGHGDIVHSTTWARDGTQALSESNDKTLRLWDSATSQCTVFQGSKISKCFGNQDGNKLASASFDEVIWVWDPTTGHQLSICEGHTETVLDVAWSPNGSQLASASIDYTVRVWNPINGHQLSICEDYTNQVHTVSWSHDGSQLVSTSASMIVISDPSTGQCILNSRIRIEGFLRFDSIGTNCLHTGLGKFDIRALQRGSADSNDSNYVPKPHGYGLSEDLSWITYDGTRVIWLPPDHRPDNLKALCLSPNVVAIGCVSGVVEFFEFSDLNPLTDL